MKQRKKQYSDKKSGSGIKEKGKSSLMWAGVLSIIYFAYTYVGVWPYLLFGAQGVELAFPDLTIPIGYFVGAAQVFVVSAVVCLVAKYILDIRKRDIENV